MLGEARKGDRKAVLILSSMAGIIGGLCCLTPIVLVLFGLASVSAAASLGNVLYGDYRWLFRTVAMICLGLGLVIYFRRSGVCSLDAAKRERNRLINVSLLVLVASAGVYIFWTYVALHYLGIAAGLPWSHYDESWAIPVSAAAFVAISLLTFLSFRRRKSKEAETLFRPRDQKAIGRAHRTARCDDTCRFGS